MKGRVKWWNENGGCGFIEYNKTENIFISLSKEDKKDMVIKENQLIEFEVVSKKEGNFLKVLKLLES
jgi:cold shock CspA family protein